MWEMVPPGEPCEPPADVTLSLCGDRLCEGDTLIREDPLLAQQLGFLQDRFQLDVASHAPLAVLVHAGVVEVGGQALILPGSSFAGKSTLVRELVRQGANYYSDEYAVLDGAGWVHPFRRPLALRPAAGRPQYVAPSELPAGAPQARPALVVFARYHEGAQWEPVALTGAAALLAVLEHTVSATLTPQRDLEYLARALHGVRTLRGVRGEAEATARKLLEGLSA